MWLLRVIGHCIVNRFEREKVKGQYSGLLFCEFLKGRDCVSYSFLYPKWNRVGTHRLRYKWMNEPQRSNVSFIRVRIERAEIEKYILKKYYRDRNKDICWLMNCGKEKAESIKTIKLITTTCITLQVSQKIKYNYVHENALWKKKTAFLWNKS